MPDMMDEIRETLAKHLPSAAVDELRKRLDASDNNKKRAESAEANLKITQKQLEDANATITKHAAIDRREATVLKREEVVKEHEMRQEVRDVQVQSAYQRVADVKEIVALVFKSPEVKSYMLNVSGNAQLPYPGGQNASFNASGSAEVAK